MSLHPTTPEFKQNAHEALHDSELQKALGHVQGGFIAKRQAAADRLPEFDVLRDAARGEDISLRAALLLSSMARKHANYYASDMALVMMGEEQ